jgi:DNA-binding PadR family transcriptional regulator
MPKAESSTYAILGLLTIEPMSGYDIRNFVREVLRNFWNESYGRIYPILSKLTREGLATRRRFAQPARPVRHVYAITPRGRAVLRQWLRQPAQPLSTRNEATLKLFLGGNLPAAHNLRALQRQRQTLLAEKEFLAGYEAAIAKERDAAVEWEYYALTLRLGQLLNDARLRWSDEAIERIGKLARAPSRRRPGKRVVRTHADGRR